MMALGQSDACIANEFHWHDTWYVFAALCYVSRMRVRGGPRRRRARLECVFHGQQSCWRKLAPVARAREEVVEVEVFLEVRRHRRKMFQTSRT